jgi:hypothetical protein
MLKELFWRNFLVNFIPKSICFVCSLLLCVVLANAQITQATQTTQPTKNDKKKDDKSVAVVQSITGEQVAESVVLVYGGFRGRETLNQIRKTTIERGKLIQNNTNGTFNNASYERRISRGESVYKDKVRLDQKFSNAEFSLIHNDSKIFGLFGDTIFKPKNEAMVAFQNQMFRGTEALLRYKENGTTVNLFGKEKQLGVEYYVVDITDKDQRKTRYFVSTKLVRIASIEYTEDSIKYVRKFYNFNYAQGTLVPSRSVLFANDKQIEETTISTITYGQKLDDAYFEEG